MLNRQENTLIEWNEHYDKIESNAFATLEMLTLIHDQIPEVKSVDDLAQVVNDLDDVRMPWYDQYESVEDFDTFVAVEQVIKSVEQAMITANWRIQELHGKWSSDHS